MSGILSYVAIVYVCLWVLSILLGNLPLTYIVSFLGVAILVFVAIRMDDKTDENKITQTQLESLQKEVDQLKQEKS